jgi:hypothetical protein
MHLRTEAPHAKKKETENHVLRRRISERRCAQEHVLPHVTEEYPVTMD